MFKNRSLLFKITCSVVIYVVTIGAAGNLFLFFHLQETVFRKSAQIDRVYEENIRFRLERNFDAAFSLAAVCAAEPEITRLASRKNRTPRELTLDSLAIQNQLNSFLRASPISPFIDKLIVFNNQGVFTQANGRLLGEISDRELVSRQPVFIRFMADNLPWASGFGESISSQKHDCYILIFRITSPYRDSPDSYLYLETGLDIITGVLKDYQAPPGIFVYIPSEGKIILSNKPQLALPQKEKLGFIPTGTESPLRFRYQGRSYRLDRTPLENNSLVLYNRADITNLTVDDKRILYLVLGTVLVTLLAAAGLAIALSVFFTRPIHILINRIQKITSQNDFSFDPEIEKRGDELGRIGHAVNEMSGSIAHFLVETEKQYRQQRNAEIALLQTQINPHFLYNTLDSIQWMAKIQNNAAIAGIISRFTGLLRNIVAGADSQAEHQSGIKITLAEELLIIEDYTELMSLRSLGTFELINKIPREFLDCLIPKFTLQPLVENSIIHGIRPSQKFGTITLNADVNDKFLDITVEDTGIGMDPAQIESGKIPKQEKKRSNPSLNNIGIANVDERLKLLYGEFCGLFYESRPGEFTKVTVRIIIER